MVIAGQDREVGGGGTVIEILLAIAVFLLLCVGAGVGVLVRGWLPAEHQTPEATLLMQLTVGLLATFAAVVLGLLTASVKQAYDNSALDRQQYALQLDLLDACLHDYGAAAAAIRADVRGYTAAVIASTWPNEIRPTGVSYPDTSRMPVVGASPVLEELMERSVLRSTNSCRQTFNILQSQQCAPLDTTAFLQPAQRDRSGAK